MDLQLQNRIALVTGGSKGIGAAIVRQLTREGARVVFCARHSQAMTSLEAEIRAEGGTCVGMPVDVFDPIAIASLVDAASAQWGGLDILVNNVGGALRFGSFYDLEDDDWIKSYEFNVMTVVRFTRAALPYLRRSTLRRIINVSSISALQPGSYNPHYSVTKAAVVNLSKHLANVLAKENILVNAVCPGPVRSASWQENIRQNALKLGLNEAEFATQFEMEESKKIPLGRLGKGEHIASVVALLASPLSDWTTGSCFHLNGGKLAATF